jgi:D-amino-acid dehydrogenase
MGALSAAVPHAPDASRRTVHVIGAGIVGASCAWWLRRAGFEVTLVEARAPGAGASAGNAGSIGLASIPPLGMPGTLRQVPQMLRDPMHALTVRWGRLPAALPWFIRFALACRGPRVEAIADARAALLAPAGEALDVLLEETGLRSLVRPTGLIHTFQTAGALEGAAYAVDMRRRRGVRLEVLSGDRLREIEPALSRNVAGGVWYPDVRTCVNPLRLTEDIARAFTAGGGRLLIERVRGFEIGDAGPRSIVTEAGRHDCDLVVLAAGAWSGRLARALGCGVSLEAEQGYHVMLGDPRTRLRVPLVSNDHHIAITPMEHGLRMSTMSEFGGLDPRPRHGRAFRILENATKVVEGLGLDVATRWSGPRPSTPDSLPVIGRSPRFANALFAFGHGHLGLTWAAITGRLIAQLATGAPTELSLEPYRPDRRFTGDHLTASPPA